MSRQVQRHLVHIPFESPPLLTLAPDPQKCNLRPNAYVDFRKSVEVDTMCAGGRKFLVRRNGQKLSTKGRRRAIAAAVKASSVQVKTRHKVILQISPSRYQALVKALTAPGARLDAVTGVGAGVLMHQKRRAQTAQPQRVPLHSQLVVQGVPFANLQDMVTRKAPNIRRLQQLWLAKTTSPLFKIRSDYFWSVLDMYTFDVLGPTPTVRSPKQTVMLAHMAHSHTHIH